MTDTQPRPLLGDYELTVLLAVLQLGDAAYGGAILREIQSRTGRSSASGALYVTLDRMESKGLIASRSGEAGAQRGGRPRRYVSVTSDGLAAVRESREALLNMMQGLESVLRRS